MPTPSEITAKKAKLLAEAKELDSRFEALQGKLKEIVKQSKEVLTLAQKQGDEIKIAKIRKQLGLEN